MKIIFLDIDGVLNSLSFYEKHDADMQQLDSCAVALLKELVNASGAELVLTSSWRYGWSSSEEENGEDGRILDCALGQFGLKLMSKTGEADAAPGESRSTEILNWLQEAPEPIESFVILDDGDFNWKKYGLAPFLVQTSFNDGGLKARHISKALRILQHPPKSIKNLL